MGTAPKKRMFSDVHIHLADPRFGRTRQETQEYVDRAASVGVVRMICASASPADWNATVELAKYFDAVFPSFGVHPWSARKISGDWISILKNLLTNFVAKNGSKALLGEVGLDFAVRDCDQTEKEMQEEAFRAQLAIADELKRPVAIHAVRANDSVLTIMKQFPNVPVWLMHGWTATESEIEKALELGAFFSFSNRSTSPDAVKARATVAAVPRDKILLESDGPRPLPPDGYAGASGAAPKIYFQRRDANGPILEDSSALIATAKDVCAIRKTNEEDFFAQLEINERRFFRFVSEREI